LLSITEKAPLSYYNFDFLIDWIIKEEEEAKRAQEAAEALERVTIDD
jgi:hypothetical protein